MKKISRFLAVVLVVLSLAACAETPRVVRSNGTDTVTATDGKQIGAATKAAKTKDLLSTRPAVAATKADPVTQTDLTVAEATTADPATLPDTAPAETKPVETKPAETNATNADREIKSNLSPEFMQILDQPENGILIIYQPKLYPEIKAITKWDITDYNTNTQILLVAKDKGSRVEVTKSQLVDDDRVVIPGDVIRDWDTTSDFEVIRIVYTDPETIPFNFIRVREPNGRVTTTPIHTSMRGNVDYEAIAYDDED